MFRRLARLPGWRGGGQARFEGQQLDPELWVGYINGNSKEDRSGRALACGAFCVTPIKVAIQIIAPNYRLACRAVAVARPGFAQ